jgi:hypothetical protein
MREGVDISLSDTLKVGYPTCVDRENGRCAMDRSWRRLAAVLAALVLFTVLPLGVSAKGEEVSLAEAVALRQQLVTAPDFAVAWRALTPA